MSLVSKVAYSQTTVLKKIILMNRVRQLVSGQARHQNRNMQSTPSPQDQNALQHDEMEHDDLITVIENDQFPSDAVTLNTFTSDANTIGDLARQGFINRCPRFTTVRTLPFVSILLTKGFFCFPSEKSFKIFLDNKRKFDNIDIETGLGIPLYQAISISVMKSMFSKSLPIMKIYKYVIIDSSIETPPESHEFVAQLNKGKEGGMERDLYKYEFCTVYKKVVDHYKRVEHKFVFHDTHVKTQEPPVYTMLNHIERMNSDTKMNDLNLQWYGTTGFASPFGSNNIKLLVLDDNMASLCDQYTMEEYDLYKKAQKTRPLGHLPVWAKYSDDNATILPKRRTLRLANFELGETDNPNITDTEASGGLFEIPWATEVLTCMSMVLHDYESRKDKRHGSNFINSSSLVSGMLVTGLIL